MGARSDGESTQEEEEEEGAGGPEFESDLDELVHSKYDDKDEDNLGQRGRGRGRVRGRTGEEREGEGEGEGEGERGDSSRSQSRSKSRSRSRSRTRPTRRGIAAPKKREGEGEEGDAAMDAQLAAIEKTVASSSKRLNSMLDKLRVRTTNMSEKTGKEIAEEARQKANRKMNSKNGSVPKIRRPPKEKVLTSKSPAAEIQVGGKGISF